MDGGQSPRPQQHHRMPEREGNNNYDVEGMDGAAEGDWWQNSSSNALLRYDDRGSACEPLMRKRTINTTSQIAIVGANICPIESLDYEYAFPCPAILLFSFFGVVGMSTRVNQTLVLRCTHLHILEF
nr:chloride channel protein CLC-c-like [Aegilops tauschii subsp. strangulata]